MGTEVALSFTSLRAQLENEKSSLYKIDESIKKIVQTSGRFASDRFNNSQGEYPRGAPRQNKNFDTGNYKNDELYGKRKHETKTVFSRLSGRGHDSDGEDDGTGGKKARVSSTVCRELPTRAAVLRAQGDDEQARKRNRRIFGSLLGTLQKFKQEEIGLQNKEEKKAQVERKIEEQARLEKEREQQERKTLFAEREHKKATIRTLETKMMRVQEYEKWELSQKSLSNFILTKAKPHIYWLPKKMNEPAQEKLLSSRKYNEKCLTKKRQELQEELERIEQRGQRVRGAKENDPTSEHPQGRKESEKSDHGEDVGHKRDKFAMDADEKRDESDGDDHHHDVSNGVEHTEKDESRVDTSIEHNNTAEHDQTQDENMDTSQVEDSNGPGVEEPEGTHS